MFQPHPLDPDACARAEKPVEKAFDWKALEARARANTPQQQPKAQTEPQRNDAQCLHGWP